ncbi:extracellular solute-binding protein [Methylocystis bryophila]|nr:extracellular solute-binding protein [Methylocystis bryophila]
MVGEPELPADFDHFPYAEPSAPKGGRLRLGVLGTFENLNRFNIKFLRAPLFLQGAVYESLMTRSEDEEKTYYGLIAESVDIDDAREHVVFHLDPRAHFSDGASITAADVAFTFALLKEQGLPQTRAEFSLVKSIDAPDARTVRFDLTGANDRELPLALAAMPVLPKHATDVERFSEATLAPPLASGPYIVSEVNAGERLLLRRDPNYWGNDLPARRGFFNFAEVEVDYYRDAGALFEAFKAGLVDFREETSATQWAQGYNFPAMSEGRIVKETIRPTRPVGIEGFGFNLRREIFRDPRVREAIAMMLDFEWINANLLSGLYRRTQSYFDESVYSASRKPASGAERALLARFPGVLREDILEGRWLPPAHDGSGRDRAIARRAIALLTEVGYQPSPAGLTKGGSPLRFEILVRSHDEERLALNFSASLARIGVDAQVRLVEEAQYNRNRQNFDFDMLVGQWLPVAEPGAEQRARWGSPAASQAGSVNLCGVASPAVDAMIDALVAARSKEDLIAAARALDRVLISGFYFVPLYHATDIYTAHVPQLRHAASNPRHPMFPYNMILEGWWRERP